MEPELQVTGRVLKLRLLFLLACTSQHATASEFDMDFTTGNGLINLCRYSDYERSTSSPTAKVLWGDCVLFVGGVVAGAEFGVSLAAVIEEARIEHRSFQAVDKEAIRREKHKILGICAPKDITGQQLGLVVVKYLKDHPEKLNSKSSALILEALEAARPCQSTH